MSVGGKLKALREERGLSIEELSDRTHIGQHVLAELERDDFSRISAAVYGSGFIKIIAKSYGIDGTSLRDEFAAQYQAWAAARAAMPKPKFVPQKFQDRRGAGRAMEQTAAAAVPAVSAPKAEKAPARGVPAPRQVPREATPAQREAPPREAPPAKGGEGLGELFEDIARERGTAYTAGAQPAASSPAIGKEPATGSAALSQPAERPAPSAAESTPAAPAQPAPAASATVADAAAPAQPTPPPRRPPQAVLPDTGTEVPPPDFSDSYVESLKSAAKSARVAFDRFRDAAGGVLASRVFQRIAASAAILLAAAWICSLMVGGGAPYSGNAAIPGAIDGAPSGSQPGAEVLGAVVPGSAAAESGDAGKSPAPPFTVLPGNALKDCLVPPPDRHAK